MCTFQKCHKMDFSAGWKVVIDILQILLRVDLTVLINSSNSSYWFYWNNLFANDLIFTIILSICGDSYCCPMKPVYLRPTCDTRCQMHLTLSLSVTVALVCLRPRLASLWLIYCLPNSPFSSSKQTGTERHMIRLPFSHASIFKKCPK